MGEPSLAHVPKPAEIVGFILVACYYHTKDFVEATATQHNVMYHASYSCWTRGAGKGNHQESGYRRKYLYLEWQLDTDLRHAMAFVSTF
jgi:hypothetical protein